MPLVFVALVHEEQRRLKPTEVTDDRAAENVFIPPAAVVSPGAAKPRMSEQTNAFAPSGLTENEWYVIGEKKRPGDPLEIMIFLGLTLRDLGGSSLSAVDNPSSSSSRTYCDCLLPFLTCKAALILRDEALLPFVHHVAWPSRRGTPLMMAAGPIPANDLLTALSGRIVVSLSAGLFGPVFAEHADRGQRRWIGRAHLYRAQGPRCDVRRGAKRGHGRGVARAWL